jgi:hypothetical protein
VRYFGALLQGLSDEVRMPLPHPIRKSRFMRSGQAFIPLVRLSKYDGDSMPLWPVFHQQFDAHPALQSIAG